MNHTSDPSAYLRDATDDLAVDTDRIVSGGIARGRTLRRRRRVGTSLAAAAVVGVIGVAASVAPGMLDGAVEPASSGFAGSTSPLPSPTERPTKQPPTVAPLPIDRLITVSASDVPQLVGDELDGVVSEPLEDETYPLVDDRQEKVVHFLFDGTLTTFSIERADSLATCAELVDPANQPDGEPGGECAFVDGLETLAWGPTTADGVTAQGVSVWQHGYIVSALSYNAADGKDVPTVTDVPPIAPAQLLDLASSEVWFEEP